jgi:hypothetical protein
MNVTPLLLSAIVIGALSASGCGEEEASPRDEMRDDDQDPEPSPEPVATTTRPSSEARAVIDATTGYETWVNFPENRERMRSLGHLLDGEPLFVLTYTNDVVVDAEAAGEFPLPDGSVIVKETYVDENDDEPMSLAVMAKRNEDWFWLEMTPEGEVLLSSLGNPLQGFDQSWCVGCHLDARRNDYVFMHEFEAPGDAGRGTPE